MRKCWREVPTKFKKVGFGLVAAASETASTGIFCLRKPKTIRQKIVNNLLETVTEICY